MSSSAIGLGFDGEAKEEGELSPPRKKKKKKRGDGEEETEDDDKEPKAIVGSRPRGQNVPLELRKENRDGIGRPKGDVGRERFVGSSGGGVGSSNVAAKSTKTTTEERVYVAYGDARRDPLTVRLFCFGFVFSRAEKNPLFYSDLFSLFVRARVLFIQTAEASHASNLALVKRLPDGAKPKLLNEVTFVLSKRNKTVKTVPNAVRYKCLYRLVAIRVGPHLSGGTDEEEEGKLKAMVEEAERVECECFEASNGNKSTYLSKVAQFTKSSEFAKVTEAMFLPKGSMLQDERSEAAAKIDLKFCERVRGEENVKFFRRAAKRARGEVDEEGEEEDDDDDDDEEEKNVALIAEEKEEGEQLSVKAAIEALLEDEMKQLIKAFKGRAGGVLFSHCVEKADEKTLEKTLKHHESKESNGQFLDANGGRIREKILKLWREYFVREREHVKANFNEDSEYWDPEESDAKNTYHLKQLFADEHYEECRLPWGE